MSGRDRFVEEAQDEAKAIVPNANVNDAEREVVKRLVEEVQKWQAAAPLGLDFVMERLARMVRRVDDVCTAVGGDMDTQRQAAIAEMHEYLRKPAVIPNVARAQAKRRKLHAKNEVALSGGYDIRTMKMLSEDWPAWLEEAELGGFLHSIAAFVREYDKCTQEFKASGVEPEKFHFMVSFDMRNKFGKIPKEMLEAIELVHKQGGLPTN